MSKGSNPVQTNTSTSSVDPATAAYIQSYRQRALGLAEGQPGDAALRRGFTQNIQYGTQGDPLGGLDQFMNPYQSNVIDTTNTDFDRQAAQARNLAGSSATQAGAFNGGRAGVLQANAQQNVDLNRSSTLAGLRSSGYQQAVQQLLQSKQNATQNGMAGLFGMNQQQLQALQAMMGGFTPTSQTQNQTQTTQTNSDQFSQLLGLGLGFAGPIGSALGGIFGGRKK